MASSTGVCDAIVENLNGLAALAKPKAAWRNIGQDPQALRQLERQAASPKKRIGMWSTEVRSVVSSANCKRWKSIAGSNRGALALKGTQ
jgi:hypothetical protein